MKPEPSAGEREFSGRTARIPRHRCGRVLLLAAGMILALPAAACAWGPVTHIFAGLFILRHPGLISAAVAGLVGEYTLDFLYGSIAADILVGKGSRPRPDHCHNWSVGRELFRRTETLPQRAFAYGYLAHLAADVIAHNFYIPSQLFTTATRGQWGHAFWEANCEQRLDPRLWKVAREVVRQRDRRHDGLLAAVWGRRPLLLRARQQVLNTTILVSNLRSWQRLLAGVTATTPWPLDDKYLLLLQNTTLGAVVDCLRDPERSAVLKHDPVGSRPLLGSRKMKRLGLATNPFLISDEIYRLRIGREVRARFDLDLNRWLAVAGRRVPRPGGGGA